MLLLYDHAITLDKEVEWIWTLRWRLPKIIFVINRYLLTLIIVLANFPGTVFPLPLSFCKFKNIFLEWSPIFCFIAAELLMIVRVCSLYGHHKLVVWSLGGLFFLVLAGTVVTQVLFIRTYYTKLFYEFQSGCFFGTMDMQWHIWVPAVCFDGVLMLLTVYKLLSYRNEMNRTITVLARDSIIYFIVIFVGVALTVADGIHTILPFSSVLVTQCIVSIGVGHMMMNIRGLVLDDPEHTVHLRTLKFTNALDSGLEIEEVA